MYNAEYNVYSYIYEGGPQKFINSIIRKMITPMASVELKTIGKIHQLSGFPSDYSETNIPFLPSLLQELTIFEENQNNFLSFHLKTLLIDLLDRIPSLRQMTIILRSLYKRLSSWINIDIKVVPPLQNISVVEIAFANLVWETKTSLFDKEVESISIDFDQFKYELATLSRIFKNDLLVENNDPCSCDWFAASIYLISGCSFDFTFKLLKSIQSLSFDLKYNTIGLSWFLSYTLLVFFFFLYLLFLGRL